GEPTEAYDWHLTDVGARVLGLDHPAVRGAQERMASRPPAPEPVQHHYVPSPESPGVYQRMAEDMPLAKSEPDPHEVEEYEPSGIYRREQEEYEDVGVWRDSEVEPTRRSHGGGFAVVALLGAAILIGASVLAVQFFRPQQSTDEQAETPRATTTTTTTAA